MKHDQFDILTRQLATSTSRRQALRTLGGAMLVGILSPILGDQAAWGRPSRCNSNEQCRRVLGEDSFCCIGVCCNGACCIDGICAPMYSCTLRHVPVYQASSVSNTKKASPQFARAAVDVVAIPRSTDPSFVREPSTSHLLSATRMHPAKRVSVCTVSGW